MDEYIKRDGVLRKFNIDDMMNVNGTLISLQDARETISNFPAADVAPVVHGRWEYEVPTINTYGMVKCTVCNWWTIDPFVSTVYNYCPNCGAKMDGWRVEGEEND